MGSIPIIRRSVDDPRMFAKGIECAAFAAADSVRVCQYSGKTDYGLTQNDYAGREALLSINPDIIFVPSDAYSEKNNPVNALTIRQIYEDPAFRSIKAVQNRQIHIIDARWLMSYSQFMVNAMEEMAKASYGYELSSMT